MNRPLETPQPLSKTTSFLVPRKGYLSKVYHTSTTPVVLRQKYLRNMSNFYGYGPAGNGVGASSVRPRRHRRRPDLTYTNKMTSSSVKLEQIGIW